MASFRAALGLFRFVSHPKAAASPPHAWRRELWQDVESLLLLQMCTPTRCAKPCGFRIQLGALKNATCEGKAQSFLRKEKAGFLTEGKITLLFRPSTLFPTSFFFSPPTLSMCNLRIRLMILQKQWRHVFNVEFVVFKCSIPAKKIWSGTWHMEREMTELSAHLHYVYLLVRKKYTLVAVLRQMNRKIKGIFLLKTEKGGKKWYFSFQSCLYLNVLAWSGDCLVMFFRCILNCVIQTDELCQLITTACLMLIFALVAVSHSISV